MTAPSPRPTTPLSRSSSPTKLLLPGKFFDRPCSTATKSTSSSSAAPSPPAISAAPPANLTEQDLDRLTTQLIQAGSTRALDDPDLLKNLPGWAVTDLFDRLRRRNALGDNVLQSALGPHLEVLHLNECSGLRRASLNGLGQACPGLTEVDLSGNKENVENKAVWNLLMHCGGLRKLVLDDCKKISDAAFVRIAPKALQGRTRAEGGEPPPVPSLGAATLEKTVGEPSEEKTAEDSGSLEERTAPCGEATRTDSGRAGEASPPSTTLETRTPPTIGTSCGVSPSTRQRAQHPVADNEHNGSCPPTDAARPRLLFESSPSSPNYVPPRLFGTSTPAGAGCNRGTTKNVGGDSTPASCSTFLAPTAPRSSVGPCPPDRTPSRTSTERGREGRIPRRLHAGSPRVRPSCGSLLDSQSARQTSVSGAKNTTSILRQVGPGFSSLEELSLRNNNQITSKGIQHVLRRAKKLHSLRLSDCRSSAISENLLCLIFGKKRKHLMRSVDLSFVDFNPQLRIFDMSYLEPGNVLTHLNLSASPLSALGVHRIVRLCPRLEILRLNWCAGVTDAAFDLDELNKYRVLEDDHYQLESGRCRSGSRRRARTPRDEEEWGTSGGGETPFLVGAANPNCSEAEKTCPPPALWLPKLRVLTLAGAGELTDETLKNFVLALPALEELDLSGCMSLRLGGFVGLGELPLKVLRMQGPLGALLEGKVNEAPEIKLPLGGRLEVLRLDGLPLGGLAVRTIAERCPNLKELGLQLSNISSDTNTIYEHEHWGGGLHEGRGEQPLLKLAKRLRRLEKLELSTSCVPTTSQSTALQRGFPCLKSLHLHCPLLDNDVEKIIQENKNLEELILDDVNLAEDTLQRWADNPTKNPLQQLLCFRCRARQLTDPGAVFLAQLLPQVVEVELDSALLTRKTLDVFLEACGHLRKLVVDGGDRRHNFSAAKKKDVDRRQRRACHLEPLVEDARESLETEGEMEAGEVSGRGEGDDSRCCGVEVDLDRTEDHSHHTEVGDLL